MGETFLLYAMAAGSAVSAFSSMQQASAPVQVAQLERTQAEQEARVTKVQAADEEARRAGELNQTLAAQRAQAAALGYDPYTSRSFMAIQDEERRKADRDITNIRLSGSYRQSRALLQGEMATAEGEIRKTQKKVDAFGKVVKAAGYAYQGYTS